MKLGSFEAFLHKTKESDRKKRRSALRIELLIVKIIIKIDYCLD